MATEFRREDNPSSRSSRKALTVTRRPRGWRVAGGGWGGGEDRERKGGGGNRRTFRGQPKTIVAGGESNQEEMELGLLETTRRAASEMKTAGS